MTSLCTTCSSHFCEKAMSHVDPKDTPNRTSAASSALCVLVRSNSLLDYRDPGGISCQKRDQPNFVCDLDVCLSLRVSASLRATSLTTRRNASFEQLQISSSCSSPPVSEKRCRQALRRALEDPGPRRSD